MTWIEMGLHFWKVWKKSVLSVLVGRWLNSIGNGQEHAKQVVRTHNWDYRWQNVPWKPASSNPKMAGDTSLMTYRGHSVLQTLIRCHFSPQFSTGQRYIYTGQQPSEQN